MASSSEYIAIILLSLAAAVGYVVFLQCQDTTKHDPREPPLIPQPLFWIGHLLGLVRNGSRYYAKVSARYPLPIYTLEVPRSRLYIVNSPELVVAVERSSKTLSFAPYVVQFANRVTLASKEAENALSQNLNGEAGNWGCRIETHSAMHEAMAPGNDLDGMCLRMLQSLRELLEPTNPDTGPTKINLFMWIRHIVTLATTNAAYGPSNPFQSSVVENAIWTLNDNFLFIVFNVYPKLTAWKGHSARAKLFQGFRDYFAANGHTHASRLIQARYEVNTKYGVPVEDIGRFEVSVSIALLVNTAPTAFWTIIYIYSDYLLLESLRDKLSAFISTSPSLVDPNKKVYRVDMTEVIRGCPLLVSLVQEVLRMQSTNAAGRIVLEDTLLDGKYLLRKGSTVLIPAAQLHANASIWGASVGEFNPSRFIKQAAGQHQTRRPASAFRAFGGGSALCPGRFLATTEIMSLVIMLVLRYNITPRGGRWSVPKGRPHIVTSVLSPDQDVEVFVTEREGHEHAIWDFNLTEYISRPEMSL